MLFTKDGKINYLQFWKLIRRFWLLILLLAFLFGGTGYLYARFMIRPTYSATTQIVAWPENITTTEDVQAAMPNRDVYSARASSTRMLSSQIMLSDMLVPDFQALLNSHLLHTRLNERLQEKIGTGYDEGYTLSADPIRDTRFVNVTVTSRDRERAPIMVNEAVGIFIEEATRILGVKNIQIVDPARIATRIAPRPRIYGVAGFIIGGLLGVGIALLSDVLDKSVCDIETLENNTHLSVLGVLPEIQAVDGQKRNEAWQEKDSSAYGEALRALRVNVEFLLPDNGAGRVYLVSSTGKGDGKSSVFASLAVALAKIDKKVLLMDVDLRRPHVHRLFGLQNKAGLVDLLTTRKSFEELVHRNVPREGMDVLTSGPTQVSPGDLLSSEKLLQLIATLREQYDYVFLDAPPSIGIADPMILGKIADTTLVVVDCAKSNRDKVASTVEHLRSGNIHVGGIILNRISERDQKDHYYKGYYSQYYAYHYAYYAKDRSDHAGKKSADQAPSDRPAAS